jgi:tetratricopeptide (TPR) repeat protein
VPVAEAVAEPQPAAVSALAAAPPDPEPLPAPAAPAVADQAPPAVKPAHVAPPPDPEPVAAPVVLAAHAAPVAQAAPALHPLSAAAEPELPSAATKPAAAASASDLQECQAALRRERAKPALVACEKLSRENPASADALVMLAHANLLAGSDGETLRLARRASFLDPKNADAYLLVGTVLQTMGRMPAARSAYQSYLQNAPHGSHAAEVRAILKTL